MIRPFVFQKLKMLRPAAVKRFNRFIKTAGRCIRNNFVLDTVPEQQRAAAQFFRVQTEIERFEPRKQFIDLFFCDVNFDVLLLDVVNLLLKKTPYSSGFPSD